MNPRTIPVRRTAVAVAALGLAAGTVLVSPAQATETSRSGNGGGQGVTRAAVTEAQRLETRLGADAAGTYYDRAAGTMVVNVTDRAAAGEVRDAGAVPRVVEHSDAELAAVTEALEQATSVTGTAWAVDPWTNRVVVSADDTVDRAEMADIRAVTDRFADRVTVERVAGEFSTDIAGGEAILGASGGRCSLGFNVRSSSGRYYFLTAGHCTDSISSWYTGSWAYLGPTVGSSFPGDDYGIVRHDNSLSKPGMVYLYGGHQDITRAANAYVGEYVRRSGSTTGVHSGYVQALNATVRYAEGTVYGLIQTNVCAEPGDSGGSLFDGTTALGLTSGGSGNCTYGGTTYFQPVTEALSVYGVSVY